MRVWNYAQKGVVAKHIPSCVDTSLDKQVKQMAPKYFPNIAPDTVIYVTGRVPVRPMVRGDFQNGATDRNVSSVIRIK